MNGGKNIRLINGCSYVVIITLNIWQFGISLLCSWHTLYVHVVIVKSNKNP